MAWKVERKRRRPSGKVDPTGPYKKPGRRGVAVVTFASVPAERWAQAFGRRTTLEQVEVFRAAKAAQEARRAEVEAPAVHGENKGAGRRLYGTPNKPVWDWGLGCYTVGRSDRLRKAKARGLQPV